MTPSPERPAAPATLSLVDAAYEQIRQRILDNAWPPGHRAVVEEDLELLEFSPKKEMHEVMDHLEKKLQQA